MKASKSPAFQFYPADWLSSAKITIMPPECEGAFIRLLSYAWLDENCSIPDDDEQLAVMSKLGEKWLKGSSQILRSNFEPHPTLVHRLVNLRLLAEREKQELWRAKCQVGGVTSGKSRRNKSKGSLDLVRSKRELKGNSSSSSSSSNISKWIAPTLEEVKLQAAKTGLPETEAEKFFHYYSDNDWMRGKNKMKRWTGALATWKINWQGYGGTKPPTQANGGRPDWAC